MVVVRKIFIVALALFLTCQMYGQQVHIRHKGCEYTVNIPTGWDTIPEVILKDKFPQLNPDMGMYPTVQKEYFADKYVLIGFLPTINSLSSFTFEQVVTDIRKMNAQTNLNNDTLAIRLDSMVAVNKYPNYWVNNYMTIRKDSSQLRACQTLHLSKFGYISFMTYQKKEDTCLSEIIDTIATIGCLRVKENYRYIHPQEKTISYKHLLYSLGIGILVYILIALLSKKRKK